jgi:signal transduction histidine kinase
MRKCQSLLRLAGRDHREMSRLPPAEGAIRYQEALKWRAWQSKLLGNTASHAQKGVGFLKRVRGVFLPASLGRWLLFLILVMLVPLLIVQAAIHWSWYNTRRNSEINANLELARSVANNFETYLKDVRRQLLAIGLAMTGGRFYGPEAVNAFLIQINADYPSVNSFSWCDTDGRVVASSLPLTVGTSIHDREYFQRVLQGQEWVVSDVLIGGHATEVSTFVVARGIYSDYGVLQGVAIAEVVPERMAVFVFDVERTAGGSISLYDRQGNLVLERGFRGLQRLLDASGESVSPLTEETLAGRETVGVLVDHEGERRITAKVPVPSIGWVAGAGRLHRDAMGPVQRALAVSWAALSLVVTVSILVSAAVSRHIVRSVRLLRAQAYAIGDGDMSEEAQVSGITELRDLEDSFNLMALRLREREEAVERGVQELSRSNRELEAFSYSVSHDLRAPLRAIDGFSEVLVDEYGNRLDEEGQRLLGIIRENTQRMGRLIDELLAYSRLGRKTIEPTEIDMNSLAREVIEESNMVGSDVQPDFKIGPLPKAYGDRVLIRQVLTNLVANAVKFSRPKPEIKIEIGGRNNSDKNLYYVKDNGVGFDMRYADKMFGVFQRLHGHSEFEGTGVGLAIVQRIVQRHGGTVWAEGKVNEGATFYFTLPPGAYS